MGVDASGWAYTIALLKFGFTNSRYHPHVQSHTQVASRQENKASQAQRRDRDSRGYNCCAERLRARGIGS